MSVCSECKSQTDDHYQNLQNMANKLRIHSVNATNASKSGHPTTCSSCAEIIAVLFFHVMHIDIHNPKNPATDRFILSKGHAAPIYYAAWAEAGTFSVTDLMSLRKIDSDLEGHPTPRLNFVDVATGSLGQGLSIAAGMAYGAKYYDKADYRIYCLIGDGESAEGSIWEAIDFCCFYRLDNLCLIVDINRLGQTEETYLGHYIEMYDKRFTAFGFKTIAVDGHNIEQLVQAFETAAFTTSQPSVILAKTFKGKNFPGIENQNNWHGKPLGTKSDEILKYLHSLVPNDMQCLEVKPPIIKVEQINIGNITLSTPPTYKTDEMVSTRVAYGTALVKLAKTCPHVIAVDCDVKNSTFSEKLKQYDSERFIDCYIAEQNMVGVAMGLACRDRKVVFASTFAAFLTRAFDQIRMGAVSQTNVNFVGTHCGVSIGEDGPSQMGLEDLSMFRSIPGSTVFYPSDAVAMERAIEIAANTKGICYIRANRPTTQIIYRMDEKFDIGVAHILKESEDDNLLIISAGVTMPEVLKAADILEKQGVSARVLDPFTVKPIDEEAIIQNARQTRGIILVIEDHYPEGGLGEAVLSAVAMEHDIIVKHIAVREVPKSGEANELFTKYGISMGHIVCAAMELVEQNIPELSITVSIQT